MFYVPESKASFFRITGGEQEMVHCEGGTTVIIPPNALRALRQLRDLSCFWTRFRVQRASRETYDS
jgi:hypothetical protein